MVATKHNDLIGAVEAAKVLNLTRAGFNAMARRGEIDAVLESPGIRGPKFYDRAEVERIAALRSKKAEAAK